MAARLSLLLAWAVLATLATPGAAATKKPVPAKSDLAIKVQKHGVVCPLPKAGVCVIKKPVGPSYRILTPTVTLEDMGSYWLADFTKAKDAKSTRLLLRVMEDEGALHEIEVRFPPDPAAKEKPVAKEPEKPREAPKEAPEVPKDETKS